MITKVDDGVYRGPRPDPLKDFWMLTETFGVKEIICLESGMYELLTNTIYDEVDACERSGIKFFGLALSFILPPSIRKIRPLIFKLLLRKRQALPVYVHCKAGVDRTGVAIAAYRVVHDRWTVDSAIREMKAMGFHWYFYWWLWSIRKSLNKLVDENIWIGP